MTSTLCRLLGHKWRWTNRTSVGRCVRCWATSEAATTTAAHEEGES